LLQTRKLAVIGLDWMIDPADDSPQARRIADAMQDAWDELDTENLMLELLDAIEQGVSLVNVAWQRTGGTWFPTDLERIHPRHLAWDFDQRRFLVQTISTPMGEALPFGAAIEHRFKARSGLATRAGLGRTVAWLYLFKHFSIKDWVVYAELFGQPYRLGKYDPATGEAERQALETAVRALGSDAAGVISKDTEIEIIEVARQGSADVYEKLTSLMNREMAQAILGQTLTSGEGEHGTQALGKVHERVRLDILRADARALAATLRRDLIRAFATFNFGPEAVTLAPYLTPQIEEPEDLESKARVLQQVQQMGLPIPARWLREEFGVPEPEIDETVLTPRTPPSSLGQRPAVNQQMLAALEGSRVAPGVLDGQQFTTGLIGNATNAARDTLAPTLERILEIVAQADGYDDLRERLLAAFPDLDHSALSRLLESSLVLADLAGQHAGRQA
jgi:phage gp29-like protein